MDFVEIYYSNVVGYYPGDSDEYKIKTKKIIDYLKDAGFSDNHILQVVEGAPASNYLTPEMLPDWLWESSLLKRDTFYYHNTLQITSKPPMFNSKTGKETVYPFYLEMQILYTMANLSKYFYRVTGLDTAFEDVKRDVASFKYLLDRYNKLSYIKSLDFVLALIDSTKDTDDDNAKSISCILDLKNNEQEVSKYLQLRVAEAEFAKANRIIWR